MPPPLLYLEKKQKWMLLHPCEEGLVNEQWSGWVCHEIIFLILTTTVGALLVQENQYLNKIIDTAYIFTPKQKLINLHRHK